MVVLGLIWWGIIPMLPTHDPFGHTAKTCRIDTYGASKTDPTQTREAFVKAFADCAPGGTVVVPWGTWKTGGITLPSEVTVRMNFGSRLSFSDDPDQYLPAVATRWEGMDVINYQPLIYAPFVKNVAIIGKGKFFGNGGAWWVWKNRDVGMDEQDAAGTLYDMAREDVPLVERLFGKNDRPLRPSFMQFYNADTVVIDGPTFVDGPMWTIHPVYSKNVILRNVKVATTGPNTDGIAIDSSENVLIERCDIWSGDDAIVIKSGLDYDGWKQNKPAKSIIVRDIFIGRGNGGVVIGSEMSGGVEQVLFEDIRMKYVDTGIRFKTLKGRGGYVRDVTYRNIRMSQLGESAIQYDTKYKFATLKSDYKVFSDIQDITFDHIIARGGEHIFRIGGSSDIPIQNFSIRNSSFSGDDPGMIHDIESGVLQNMIFTPKNKKPIEMKNVNNMSILGYFPRGGSRNTYALFKGKYIGNISVHLWPCPNGTCTESDVKVPAGAIVD